MRYKVLKHALLLAALLPVACAQDEEAGRPAAPPAATAIVEYLPAEAATRAISHTALPAHQRIRSLTYLLYDENGGLVKRREIPDVDRMGEGDWPMRRATMTWAQREALKDTLRLGQDYTALFIANADESLFGGEQVLHTTTLADGQETALALEDVYLSLPRTAPFDDHNLFYLCVLPVHPAATTDRDYPLSCPVQLSRIVSRTDFFTDDYEGWGTDFAREGARKMVDKIYDQVIAKASMSSNELHANDMLKEFTLDFAGWCATSGAMGIPTFPAWEADFAVKVNGLDCTPFMGEVSTSDAARIKDILYEKLLANARLQELWRPWAGLTARVAYDGCADRLYVAGLRSGSQAGDALGLSPALDIVPTADGKHHTFTLIGFGENPGTTDATVQTRMAEVRFYASPTDVTPLFTVPLTDNVRSFARLEGNHRVQLSYLPIKTLTYLQTELPGIRYELEPVNLKDHLASSLFIDDVFPGILQNFFDERGGKYGASIESFALEITLPDLSRPDALTLEPEWSVKDE